MTRIERDVLRVIDGLAAAHGLALSANLIASRPWCSALFVGYRLIVAVTADDDEGLDQCLALMPDAELLMRNHFVASADVIARGDRTANIELLVVEG